MTFDWNQYRILAEELRGREDEAARRSSISRLYYAVYWQARLYLEDDGFILTLNDGSHRQVWNAFRDRGITHRVIGVNGDRLRRNRVDADYVADIARLQEMLNESFHLADKVRSYLDQIQRRDDR
jgi:uncharacterized protein (UPF0332 family)